MPSVVIVADMLRGFMEEGYPLYMGRRGRSIIPGVRKLLENELARGSRIIFICDNHVPNDPEFRMFPPHCIAGTVEAEVIPELAGYPGEKVFKRRYSGFYGTELDNRLEAIKPDKLIICGVFTNICVLYTTAEARSRYYEVEVPVDCVAAPTEREHRFALDQIERVLGAKLTSVTGIAAPRISRFEPAAEVTSGETADIYFARTKEILEKESLDPVATMEVFSSRAGVLCGIEEVKALLSNVLPASREVWALGEGEQISAREVVLRITAPYQSYALYETAYLGILAHSSGWATAARECVEAAGGIPVISFGARHIHPSVSAKMEYAAITGGCAGCSSIAGANLAGIQATGTMPHALIIVMGDTVQATLAFDRHVSLDVRRVALVDTFKDEAEESLRVAAALGDRLNAVRLDTPSERGRVTVDLVKEVRARLDQAGFRHVGVFVSGGFSAERIREFMQSGAPVDGFGVGSYISGAKPIDFTADLHEVAGKPVAKRGRIPGITPNPRLKRVM